MKDFHKPSTNHSDILSGKPYNPQKTEKKIYRLWEKSGYFNPDRLPLTIKGTSRIKNEVKQKKHGKPFTIIMPPPNANGSLHIGHAVFVTLEDIMIRYKRMRGYKTLWLPGADHAGILTQVVYEKELAKQGKTRFDLGREEFYRQTYKFSMKNKKIMENQLRQLGASCDWSREKFTLDPKISKIVLTTFVKMYEDGLIYRGERIINWCPRCQTALSDLEVIHKPRQTKLYYINYHIKDSDKFITVATTRPETMLGDAAVAVNPNDKRYKNLIGQKAVLPLINREIPIIADLVIDASFGTGAVKITPAHDPDDFEIAQKHKLPALNVIGEDGKMTKLAGVAYEGLDVLECRTKILTDLKAQNFLEKEEDHPQNIAVCERCGTIIEPLISKQWFIKIKPLTKKAIEVVKKGKIKFIPSRFAKIYFHWLNNIKDWCISRQLWWGHRIPVYYCQNENCSETIVSVTKVRSCPKCKGKIEQDPDTLDTWFSSGQWPYTTLLTSRGNPKPETGKTKSRLGLTSTDYKTFYPTDVMETGWDILFFWVARMIMLGIYATGKIPFHVVYLHGLVRDKERQKMSKSKGNVIDPLGVINLYGADALRMALITGNAPGNDPIIYEEKIKGYRNFANKIWQATRFVLMNTKDYGKVKIVNDRYSKTKYSTTRYLTTKPQLNTNAKKHLKNLKKLVKETTKLMDDFKFYQAAEKIYHYFWHTFADKIIEESKPILRNGTLKERLATQYLLLEILKTNLKLLHPFMPFITERIWQELVAQKLTDRKLLMVSEWPP